MSTPKPRRSTVPPPSLQAWPSGPWMRSPGPGGPAASTRDTTNLTAPELGLQSQFTFEKLAQGHETGKLRMG